MKWKEDGKKKRKLVKIKRKIRSELLLKPLSENFSHPGDLHLIFHLVPPKADISPVQMFLHRFLKVAWLGSVVMYIGTKYPIPCSHESKDSVECRPIINTSRYIPKYFCIVRVCVYEPYNLINQWFPMTFTRCYSRFFYLKIRDKTQ